jgi:antitoxin VapB
MQQMFIICSEWVVGISLVGAQPGLDGPTRAAAYAVAYAQHLESVSVMTERHVKLFKNGRNQAVRIPRDFELPGEDAIIRKDGQRLIIEPAPPRSLLAILATLPSLDEDFPPFEDRPAEPVDL